MFISNYFGETSCVFDYYLQSGGYHLLNWEPCQRIKEQNQQKAIIH
jgi:hypothetical protein